MANHKFVKSATALVLGASVLTSAVLVPGANASAKTTYKVTKKGTLVNAKTNKTVKGYKSYKGKLYNNGKKFTGVYSKRYYKNGVKATGTYKGAYYVKGVKKVTTGTYAGAYYVKGIKKVTTGTYSGAYYVKGVKKVTTGTYNKAYYVKGKKVVSTGLYENKYYKDGVLNVGLALFQDKLYKDADLANGVFEFNNDTNAYENGVVVKTSVASVSAVNQSEITLSGAALGKLKAADVTVAGVEVTSLTPSADWKTATVKLNGSLPANKDVKVSVKVGTETKDLTVNYAFGPKAVSVLASTYDDDTANQKLTVLVDGVATSVDYLLSSGYNVEFNAYDSEGKNVTTDLFASSTTGSLKSSGLKTGTYKVTVVVSKGSAILNSEKAEIKIANLDNAATAISDYELANTTTSRTQTSSTLVVNESAVFENLVLGVGSNKAEVATTLSNPNVKVTSSDDSVISVASNNTITANKIGTATLKITVGKVTKEVTITVKGEQRYAKSIVAANQSIFVDGNSSTSNIKILDQYGDVLKAGASGLFAVVPTDVTGLTFGNSPELVVGANGTAPLTLGTATVAGQSGTVVVKDLATKSVVGTFTVKTTADNAIASTKLTYAPTSESSDDVIDAELASDDTVEYQLSTFNKDGVKIKSAIDLAGYKVKFNGSVVKVNGDATGEYKITSGTSFTVSIKGKGTTTVAIYDANNNLVDTKTVTVNTAGTSFKSVAWKSAPEVTYGKQINYKDVLNITEGATNKDDIVKDVTLSSPVANSVRIYTGKAATTAASTDKLSKGDLYIDRDDSGDYSTGDTVIGTVTAKAAANSTNLDATNAIDGAKVVTGTVSKGSVIFSVVVDGNVITDTSVKVNVTGTTLLQQNLDAAKAKAATAATAVTNAQTAATKAAKDETDAKAVATKADADLAAANKAKTDFVAANPGADTTTLDAAITAAQDAKTKADAAVTAATAAKTKADADLKTAQDAKVKADADVDTAQKALDAAK
ncbi:hypothetical protein [Rummeliibacillus pycnus]|uniref:hypothetical protein n=1 Tax=Rummeliibacillus pycnus TaxID=101070 RepID=UPI0037C64A35